MRAVGIVGAGPAGLAAARPMPLAARPAIGATRPNSALPAAIAAAGIHACFVSGSSSVAIVSLNEALLHAKV